MAIFSFDHLHLEQPIITSLSGEVVEILVQNGQWSKDLLVTTNGQPMSDEMVQELEAKGIKVCNERIHSIHDSPISKSDRVLCTATRRSVGSISF